MTSAITMDMTVDGYRRAGAYLSIVITVVCCLVLTGWQLNIEVLKRLSPYMVAMNPVTAVTFLGCVVSLRLLSSIEKVKRIAGYSIAGIIALIACIKLAGLFTPFNLPVDSLLFADKLTVETAGQSRNQMAPNTAFCFLLSSLALLTIHVESFRKIVWSQLFAVLIGLTGLLSVIGYLYKVTAFYGVMNYIPMALHTALCFLLLSMALLFTNSEKWLMREFTGVWEGSKTARRLIPAAVALPVGLGYLRLQSHWHSLFSTEFGVALLVLSIITVFLLLLWYQAAKLNRRDKRRIEAEQQLGERSAQLEAANKELEAFTYSASHDLKAPLRIMSGFANILVQDYGDKVDEDFKKRLSTIAVNASRMNTLIDDLLDFSRIGRADLTKRLVDMNDAVKVVIQELTADNPELRAEIKATKLDPATCDPKLVKQVWVNLISNAVKYSSKNPKPLVEIGALQTDGRPVYYVKDNGAGFDMQYAHKLFNVFNRLHSRTDFEGTGVGLAIAHRIVTRHGGKIWAQGKINEGATFFFTLN
ncbi:MAG: ATP-binding protein [Chitinophagales bacterium]